MKSRGRRRGGIGAAFAASYIAVVAFHVREVQLAMWELHRAWTWSFSGLPDVAFHQAVRTWPGPFEVALIGCSVGAMIVARWRSTARKRLGTQGVDILAPLRRRLTATLGRVRAVVLTPALLTWLYFLSPAPRVAELAPGRPLEAALTCAAVALVPAGVALLVARAFVRRLLAPTAVDAVEEPAAADKTFFSGVAVTFETRAAVALVGLISLGVILACAVLPFPGDGALVTAMLLQAVVCIGAPLLFGRLSRVAVGLDGISITGTSRARFFPYRDFDGARLTLSGDILVSRGGRTVLRLQLLGADSAARMGVVERIQDAIARLQAPDAPGASRAASAMVAAQAARCEADYRALAVTREELWALLEEPMTPAGARAGAAGALAIDADERDRARIRIVGERCAEPASRAALLRIAGDSDDEEALVEAATADAGASRASA